MPFEYATSQDFLSLSELQIDSYFGIFSLYSMLQKELKNIQGTSIKGMTKSDLLEKKVTIPKKYEEQQKIGTFFQQLDNLITLHQRKDFWFKNVGILIETTISAENSTLKVHFECLYDTLERRFII